MVMHARKTQRIGDGYFDKHQAHPYQNSKYSSSKGNYDRDRDRMRDRDSPNGNSYRSDSPECESPRERSSYHKTIYLSKRERENREYKSRDKSYSDCVRSPKDKRSRESRDSEHRTNHDRNSSEDKQRDDRDRVVRCGDWSEHISSSGKKYYYNCKTEVSQWEKPREWVEPTGSRSSSSQSRHNYISSSSSSSSSHHQSNSSRSEKHSSGGGGSGTRGPAVGGAKGPGPGSREVVQVKHYWAGSSGGRESCSLPLPVPSPHLNTSDIPQQGSDSRKQDLLNNATPGLETQATDMELCSNGSTPTSENSYGGPGGGGAAAAASGPQGSSSLPGPETLASGPNAPGPPPIEPPPGSIAPTTSLPPPTDHGPPTPTHSEHELQQDPRKILGCLAGTGTVPGPGTAQSEGRPLGTPLSGLVVPSGASVPLQPSPLAAAIRPQVPTLTPSLANHYRDDLVNHVRGWPAEAIEKQAQKFTEEDHQLGAMCTRVSAELKCARSIVRQTEIQATLQEQRVLFLLQQIKTLEELKSQNSFMADEG